MSSVDIRERFLRDHARINTLAAELIALLELPSPPEVGLLSKARWAFASSLMQHLAIKERHIYAKLESDTRLEVRSFFASSKVDLMRRFDEYTSHMDAWPTVRAMSDWPAYSPKAIAVVRIFTERLKQEETELFDTVAGLGIDMNVPSAVTANWTRKAFDVKAKVETR